jgi:hypothetical protein
MAGRKLPLHRLFTNDFSAEEKRSPGFAIRAENGRFFNLLSPPNRGSRHGTKITIWVFFSRTVSVRARLWACFRETGEVSACLGFFDPPRIPQGISVENHVLEISGLDSGSGLKMGLSGLRLCRERISLPWKALTLPFHYRHPCESSHRRTGQRFLHTLHTLPFEIGEWT